jgi:hypothetical protein
VLDMYRWILKSDLHDVRWEKVDRIKRILTGGSYPVPPKQVAMKLIEQMLEHGRGNHRWERSRSGKTNDSCLLQRCTRVGVHLAKVPVLGLLGLLSVSDARAQLTPAIRGLDHQAPGEHVISCLDSAPIAVALA